MQVAVKAAAAKAGAALPAAEVERAADDSIRAMMLIRTYRVRGHLAATLDPLGLSQRERSEEHTSETPVTHAQLVCRLLLEKNNNNNEHTRLPLRQHTKREQAHHE